MAELLTWHGELPRGWRAVPLAFLVDAISGSTPTKDEATYWGGVIPWVSPKDMKRPVIADAEDHITKTALAKSGIRLVQPEAVLVVVRGMILAHSFPVGVTTVPVTVNQDMKALKPRRGIEPWFLAYALRACTAPMLGLVEQAGHGTCKLRTDLWRRFPLPLPPIEAQRAIISFLDRKTAAIDALIAKKERLIELLEEKRQALITQAVTKGLDPNVPMKDSGIDWLGPIPVHWDVAPLRRLVRCLDGRRVPLNSVERSEMQGEIPYWGSNGIVDYIDRYLFDEELVLLGEDGSPFFDPVKPVAFRITGRVWINNHIHVLRPVTIDGKYLAHALNIVEYADYIDGSTRDKLTQTKMNDIPVPRPPRDEQAVIAAYLDAAIERFTGTLRHLEESIARLREYRQALITAAVTGKIDVTQERA